MKKQMIQDLVKGKRGITLIALVITIIVLLILAGISISMLSGDNSILKKATDAKEMTDKAQVVEKARLDIMAKVAEKRGSDLTDGEIKEILGTYFTNDTIPQDLTDLTQKLKTKSGGYNVELSEILKGVNIATGKVNPTELTINLEIKNTPQAIPTGGNVASVNDENIPIPTGFYPVADTEKTTGFVISSVEGDDINNTKGGNQFVWVPVNQNQKLKLEISAPEDITAIKLTDPAGEVISVGTFSGNTFTNDKINPTYNGEYKVEVTAGETKSQTLVVRSLYAKDIFNDYFTDEWTADAQYNMYKGYGMEDEQIWQMISGPAGKNITNRAEFDAFFRDNMRGIGYKDLEEEDYTNSVNTYGGFYIGRYEAGSDSGTLVSKANVDPYVNVKRSKAKDLAVAMYSGKSHLLTDAAWDRTLGWIIQTSNNVDLSAAVANSSGWGNYSDSKVMKSDGTTVLKASETATKLKTGETTYTKVNNIYDLAGNVYEWTSAQSPNSDYPCVIRGGSYDYTGSYSPASNRYLNEESIYDDFNGIRVALFL